jgi:hypothetical protein
MRVLLSKLLLDLSILAGKPETTTKPSARKMSSLTTKPRGKEGFSPRRMKSSRKDFEQSKPSPSQVTSKEPSSWKAPPGLPTKQSRRAPSTARSFTTSFLNLKEGLGSVLQIKVSRKLMALAF